MLTLKPQGWNFDVGIKACTRASRLELEWGGKEEAGDDEEGKRRKGGKIIPPSASPKSNVKAQVIGRRVGLKGKKESGKAEREKWQERINKCVHGIKCERVGYWFRIKGGMKKGGKGRNSSPKAVSGQRYPCPA